MMTEQGLVRSPFDVLLAERDRLEAWLRGLERERERVLDVVARASSESLAFLAPLDVELEQVTAAVKTLTFAMRKVRGL